MTSLPSSPSQEDLQYAIDRLRSINLRTAEVDQLKEYLTTLFTGYFDSCPIIPSNQVVYRGVRWRSRPTNISQLSYPPCHLITSHQRANRPGQHMFYCSIAREAPFFELSLEAGELVAISKWRSTHKLFVNNVGYHASVFTSLDSARAPQRWSNADSPPTSQSNEFVREFFAQEFAKIVSYEYEYKMSVAIAEKLLGKLEIDSMNFPFDCEPHFAGILYPTIAMRANSDNLALIPRFVDRFLRMEKVEYILVKEKKPDFKYDIQVIDFSNSFEPDGTINWKGRHPVLNLQPGEEVMALVENGKWVFRKSSGEILEPND